MGHMKEAGRAVEGTGSRKLVDHQDQDVGLGAWVDLRAAGLARI